MADGLSVAIIEDTLERILGNGDVGVDIGFLKDASLCESADLSSQMMFYRNILSDVASEPLQDDPDGAYGIGTLKLSRTLDDIARASKRLGTTSANLLA